MLGATLHVLLCGNVRVRGVDREGYGLLQGHRAGLTGESLAFGYSVRFRPGIDGVLPEEGQIQEARKKAGGEKKTMIINHFHHVVKKELAACRTYGSGMFTASEREGNCR